MTTKRFVFRLSHCSAPKVIMTVTLENSKNSHEVHEQSRTHRLCMLYQGIRFITDRPHFSTQRYIETASIRTAMTFRMTDMHVKCEQKIIQENIFSEFIFFIYHTVVMWYQKHLLAKHFHWKLDLRFVFYVLHWAVCVF